MAVNQPFFKYQGEYVKKFIFIISTLAFVLINNAQAESNQEGDITQVMLNQWDTPQNPLTVGPVVVAGKYAIAGWIQGVKGGRALLYKNHENWQVLLCGGDALTKVDQLTQAGLDIRVANSLIKEFKKQEQQLSSQEIEKMSLFDGIVKVTPTVVHQHH